MKKTSALLAFAMALPLTLSAETPGAKLNAAKKKANEEKKHLLMIFTASGWHQASQKFDKAVLQNEAFQKGVEEDFVHVTFDFPRKRSEAHTDLLEMQQKFRFRNMPFFILADPQGRPYSLTGATSSEPVKFLKTLGELHKIGTERDRLFAEAHKTKGMARAKLLVEALESLPQDQVFEFYAPELAAIADADREGKTGYVDRIEKAEALRQEQARYDMHFKNRDFDRIIKEARTEAAKLKGEDAQRLKLYEIRALTEKHEFQQAMKEVEVMTKLAPESGFGKRSERYQGYIKNAETRHERMLEAAKNPKKARERKPIVSKPVAIVTDFEQLKKEAKETEEALAKAVAEEAKLKKAKKASASKVAGLEAELKKLREDDKKASEAAQKAAAEREKLARKSQAMKDVVENHLAMEKRKRDIAELEKKAADLQKEAEKLRDKADSIKKGK